MTEQNTQTNAPGQPPKDSPPLFHEYGLLEQFNLPPKAIRFIRANQRKIWGVVIACAAAALLIAGIDAYFDYRLKKAAEALDAAMQASGAEQRELLAGVSRKYGSTPSAQWAEVNLARLDEEGGKPEEAIARYRKLQGKFPKNSPMQPLLLGRMAALEEGREQWDAALSLYKSLSENNEFAPDAFLGMGRIHEARGKKDEALAMYKKFVEYTAVSTEESGVDPRRQMVLTRLEEMQGGFAKEPELPPMPEEPQVEAATTEQAGAAPEVPAVCRSSAGNFGGNRRDRNAADQSHAGSSGGTRTIRCAGSPGGNGRNRNAAGRSRPGPPGRPGTACNLATRNARRTVNCHGNHKRTRTDAGLDQGPAQGRQDHRPGPDHGLFPRGPLEPDAAGRATRRFGGGEPLRQPGAVRAQRGSGHLSPRLRARHGHAAKGKGGRGLRAHGRPHVS